MRLALFDLDNTLLAGDSDFEWAQFLIEQGVLDREVYEARNQHFYEQYKAGTLDIHEFLDFQLKPLSRHARKQLEGWHREFMRLRILPIITQKARDLVASHVHDARAVVTATNSFVTCPIAREFGIEHLVATEPEESGGEFTGRVQGVPAFREGKVARVEGWLAELVLDWGVLRRNLVLQRLAQRPAAAVEGDSSGGGGSGRDAEGHALEQGWMIISLR